MLLYIWFVPKCNIDIYGSQHLLVELRLSWHELGKMQSRIGGLGDCH